MTWESTQREQWGVEARTAEARLSPARRLFPGILAAAATAGVLVGDGWRQGTAWVPFIELGARWMPGTALPQAILGVVLHAGWLIVWGICFTLVARSLRGGRLFLAGVGAALALALLAWTILPRALGAAEPAYMSSAHVALYLLVIAGALSLGTRLARYA